MPEIRYYLVTQTREVRVRANSLEDACALATAAFTHGQNSDHGVKLGTLEAEEAIEGVWGNTVEKIREVSIATSVDEVIRTYSG